MDKPILKVLALLFLVLCLLLPNSASSAPEAGPRITVSTLSSQNGCFFTGDEIIINITNASSQEYTFRISSTLRSYTYRGDFNELMLFYPLEEDIYTAALVEKSTGATIYQVSFNVSSNVSVQTQQPNPPVEPDYQPPAGEAAAESTLPVSSPLFSASIRIRSYDNVNTAGQFDIRAYDDQNQEVTGSQLDSFDSTKKFRLEIRPRDGVIKSLILNEAKKALDGTLDIGLEEVAKSKVVAAPGKFVLKVFAVDPTRLIFTSGIITLTATGTELWKCKSWDYAGQNCPGSWEKIMDLTPGQDYALAIDANDPGFTETSPSTGTPDAGNSINVVNVNYVGGTYTDTQTNNNVYFAAGVNNGAGQQLDPTGYLNLTYNITQTNLTRVNQIYEIQVNVSYCHSNDIAAPTICSALQSGTALNLSYAEIFNYNTQTYVQLGVLGLRDGVEGVTNYNVTSGFSNYVSSNNLTNIRYGYQFNITTNNRDAVLAIDYAPITILFDKQAPTVNFSAGTDQNGTYVRRDYIQINLSANDTRLYNITAYLYNSSGTLVRNASVTAYQIPQNLSVNFTSLSDGLYFFNATAFDNGSNMNYTATWNVTVDTVNPWIIFASRTDASGQVVTRNYTFMNATANDTNLYNITVYLFNSTDGLVVNNTITASSNNASIYQNYTDLAEGLYYYNATSFDKAGNINSTETRNISLDLNFPSVQLVPPSENSGAYLNRSYLQINASGNDTFYKNLTAFVFNSSGFLVANATTDQKNLSFNASGLSDGRYFFNATACDQAGKCNSTETRNATLDTTKPAVNFIPPTYNSTNIINWTFILINASASDLNYQNLSISVYNSSGDLANYSNTTATTLYVNVSAPEEGDYYFNATACDVVGNCNNTETRIAIIDLNPPVLNLTTPENNTPLNYSVMQFTYTVNDTASGVVNCSLYIDDMFNETNNTIQEGVPQSFTNKNLSDGWHNWSITCTDSVGKTSQVKKNAVYIDTVLPTSTLISPADYEVINVVAYSFAYAVNTTYVDASNVTSFFQYRYNSTSAWVDICNITSGAGYNNCTWDLSGLPYGSKYQVRVFARDVAGNLESTDENDNITLRGDGVINITSIFVDDSSDLPVNEVDLNAGSTKTVICNVSVQDPDSYQNISMNATFYSLNASYPPDDNNATHYTNNSCTRVYGFDYDAQFICDFEVWYYAQNDTWACRAEAWNDYSNANLSDNTTMNQLFALNVSSALINYTTLPAEKESSDVELNITNMGNVPINISVYGFGGEDPGAGANLSMICQVNNISVEFHRFSTTVLPFDSKINLSYSPKQFGLTLTPQNDTEKPQNATYWQLKVPGSSLSFGECNGSIVFSANPS